MAASYKLSLLTFLTVISSTLVFSTASPPTIYEIVQQFGFPAGILPDSVTSYTTNEEASTFVVYLKKPCYVKFDYLVYFDTKITGKISYGHITELKGLQAKSFLFWLNIDEIKVNSDSLSFTLGLVTVNLDIAQFQTIPTCKDNTLSACDHSSKVISPLPITAEEVDMVIME